MIKTTNWRPDTCGCKVSYTWDSDVNAVVRIHSYEARLETTILEIEIRRAIGHSYYEWEHARNTVIQIKTYDDVNLPDDVAVIPGFTLDDFRVAPDIGFPDEIVLGPTEIKKVKQVRERRCRPHSALQGSAWWDEISVENVRKNGAIEIIEKLSPRPSDDPSEAVGWEFDLERVLLVTTPRRVDRTTRDVAQAQFDVEFGSGKARFA